METITTAIHFPNISVFSVSLIIKKTKARAPLCAAYTGTPSFLSCDYGCFWVGHLFFLGCVVFTGCGGEKNDWHSKNVLSSTNMSMKGIKLHLTVSFSCLLSDTTQLPRFSLAVKVY